MEEKERFLGEPRHVPTFADSWESDADAFEEGMVDAAWIPDMHSWMSLGEFRNRVDELEEEAGESLERKREDFDQAEGDL